MKGYCNSKPGIEQDRKTSEMCISETAMRFVWIVWKIHGTHCTSRTVATLKDNAQAHPVYA